MTDADRTHQAYELLRTVPLDLLVRECNRRGHQVCLHQLCRLTQQRVVKWYEMTEEEIPFDAERDR